MGRDASATKHEAIIDAALTVFLERGYLGTSMDEIASQATVSKQTVYKHFADKERLFAEIVLATVDEVERLVRWTVEEFDRADSVEGALQRLARRFLSSLMEPRLLRLRRLVIANADRFPHLGRNWYEAGFERVLSALEACFARLNGTGALRVDDARSAANHFVGMLLWIPINKAMFTGEERPFTPAELTRLADSSVRAFLQAYGNAGSPKRSKRRRADG